MPNARDFLDALTPRLQSSSGGAIAYALADYLLQLSVAAADLHYMRPHAVLAGAAVSVALGAMQAPQQAHNELLDDLMAMLRDGEGAAQFSRTELQAALADGASDLHRMWREASRAAAQVSTFTHTSAGSSAGSTACRWQPFHRRQRQRNRSDSTTAASAPPPPALRRHQRSTAASAPPPLAPTLPEWAAPRQAQRLESAETVGAGAGSPRASGWLRLLHLATAFARSGGACAVRSDAAALRAHPSDVASPFPRSDFCTCRSRRA